jgi:hypothetical protein
MAHLSSSSMAVVSSAASLGDAAEAELGPFRSAGRSAYAGDANTGADGAPHVVGCALLGVNGSIRPTAPPVTDPR